MLTTVIKGIKPSFDIIIVKCCNCPNNVTVVLVVVVEVTIAEVHVPAVVLTVLGTGPIVTGR
jgi:hypothetical protein